MRMKATQMAIAHIHTNITGPHQPVSSIRSMPRMITRLIRMAIGRFTAFPALCRIGNKRIKNAASGQPEAQAQ